MERDFMGLNSKESVVAVKDDVSNEVKDSAPTKAPASQWPYADKVPATTHFLRHISTQEDSSNKTIATPVGSSGFPQKNVADFFLKQSAAAIAGVPDLRNKPAGSPAQMTIFYNGTVKVYDSITPEKAQAILFLAGNGSLLATIGSQIQPPTPKCNATDTLHVNQRVNGQLPSNVSSPISVSPHSVSSSTNTDGLVTNPDCKMNTPTKPIMASGIPQFRKVSLARFLEKRKERAMNAAPYNAAKKPECAS